mgnify:CR=1 FL=1
MFFVVRIFNHKGLKEKNFSVLVVKIFTMEVCFIMAVAFYKVAEEIEAFNGISDYAR